MRTRRNYQSFVGSTFGMWTLLAVETSGRARFTATCACGRVESVDAHSVVSGRSVRCKPCAFRISGPQDGHGATRGRKTTPEFNTWRGMIERCTNRKHRAWRRYGGRGITVCERWRESFADFLADMGTKPSSRHSIERVDNSRGYEPGNCKWATPEEQARNRSTTRLITVQGVTQCAEDWGRANGIPPGTIYDRLRRGVDPAKAVGNAADHWASECMH